MDITNSTNDTNSIGSDPCTLTDEEINHSYNLSLHIASVFVLLVVSFLGASISVASSRVKALYINPIIINTGKFFGCGVILATGFVHILPDAMETLTDPCLPDSWNVYGAYSGLFAMLAALSMQLIEFLAHQRFRSSKHEHTHLKKKKNVVEFIEKELTNGSVPTKQANNEVNGPSSVEPIENRIEESNKENSNTENLEQIGDKVDELERTEQITEVIVKPKKKKKRINGDINYLEELTQANHEIDQLEKHIHNKKDASVNTDETYKPTDTSAHKDAVAIEMSHIDATTPELCEESAHHHGAAFQNDSEHNKISTYLLEMGIALHSILIGLTLGTTTESFVALFIALCFHQFFEAVALGAQIANLKTTSTRSAISMVIFFALTTPVGIAIGIGIHSGTYNPKAVSTLIVTGILDSLAAGILIYVALVNLISAEMGVNAHAFYSLSSRLKFLYFAALYLGVGAMAVIGRWA